MKLPKIKAIKPDTNRLRLKWKIFAFLLGFCALLLIILWLFQTVFLDSFYRSIKVMEIKNNAHSIAANIDNPNLSDLVTSIAQSNDLSAEVMTKDGKILNSAGASQDLQIHDMALQDKVNLVSAAQSQGGEYFEYRSSSPPASSNPKDGFIGNLPPNNQRPDQSLIYVKIVNTASGDPVAIFLDATISPVNATVTTLRIQLYFVTGIMIILSIALALLIAKRVAKPIEDINQSAKILAKGDYDAYFNGKGFLEIAELSTTLNTAAAELSKVDALRRELMANISHDLRTPLSLIYSYAEMMHDFPEEVTPEQTQIIMEETERLTTLVNDVLDISKLESGIQQLNVSQFNLTQSIKTTTERLAELIKKSGFRLTFLYDREVSVRADEVKITQVFYNLLINAINYTGKDKTITVRQITAAGSVRIEVTDSGDGIAAKDLPYVWDRYYKVDKKHKRPVTGTGLGLSIVKNIMKLHGGEYGVESQLGAGSTFWFSLKAAGR